MAWVRFDDTFPEHPKVLKVGGDAVWMHVCALAYCNRLETDGVIPTGVVGRLSDRKDANRLAAKLVSEGLWDVHPEGWEIHDYHDFQPSKAELEQRREARAQAGRKGGVKSGETRRERSKPEANSEANASGLLEAKPERSGTPTRPDPTRTTQVSTQLQPPTDCAEVGEVDVDRISTIISAYASQALNTAKAKGVTIGSEIGYTAKARATAREHPDLHRLASLFPTAPADVVAAALHGEKHSLQHYPRADELADVIELRPA